VARRKGPRSMKSRVYGSATWRRVRREVLARDGGVCKVRSPVCRGTGEVVDHIEPWQDGGSWYAMSNLRASCRACNTWVRYNGQPPAPSQAPAEKWPQPALGDNCPHRAPDGSWCVGEKFHWSRWWGPPGHEPETPEEVAEALGWK
jgi:hypothetical protein